MPFITMVGAIIDLKKGKLTFEVGDERIEFVLAKLTKNPSIRDSCSLIDIINACIQESSSKLSLTDGLEACSLLSTSANEKYEAKFYEEVLDESPTPIDQGFEALMAQSDESVQQEPWVELKKLPQTLKYEFLDKGTQKPVIVNVNLGESETAKLLVVLRKYPKAIKYTIDDLKAISPYVCMHKILLEDDVVAQKILKRRTLKI